MAKNHALWYYCAEREEWDSETVLSEIWQDLTAGNIYTNPAVGMQMSEMAEL